MVDVPMPKIKISVDAAGCGTLTVDGVDWSNVVHAVAVEIRSGELTKVTVTLSGDVELDAPAEVLQVRRYGMAS